VQTKIKQSCEGQEATGPTVILVDAAGNFRGFSPMPELAEALAPDFAVFTYDRRGKGASTDTLPYAVDREFDDLQALIGLAGGSAFVHGFSSGATLALLAAEHGLGIAKLSLLEPPLQVDATPPPAAPGISGEVARLIIAGRRGDAYEHWMRGHRGTGRDDRPDAGRSPVARPGGHRARPPKATGGRGRTNGRRPTSEERPR
jgi:pimeloyl-ACP methyl ester carboxylesterase